jgi:hypothetical protein
MDAELIKTLRLIIDRYGSRTQGSVFIPISDFPWYSERSGQLITLYEEGFITKPRFYGNGAEITLTKNGRYYFDRTERTPSLMKERTYGILKAINDDMKLPDDNFGYGETELRVRIRQLQEESYIAGVRFAEGGLGNFPLYMWLDEAYITVKGLEYIEEYEKMICEGPATIGLSHEFVSACAKIADNPASYAGFDEDKLNREVRNLLDSAITRFGYLIADQTQQGYGESERSAGELDIRISKNGLPVAIYEGLIHRDKKRLYDHIDKAIRKYNQSGCEEVFVIEFSKNKRFGEFWDNAINNINGHPKLRNIKEVNTGLLGIRMLKGNFDWEDQQGVFSFIGVKFCA